MNPNLIAMAKSTSDHSLVEPALEEYINAMHALPWSNLSGLHEIEIIKELEELFPQYSHEVIKDKVEQLANSSLVLPAPPIRVKGTIHIFEISKLVKYGETGQSIRHGSVIRFSDYISDGDFYGECELAQTYARQNWGWMLVDYDFAECFDMYLIDPSDFDEEYKPRLVHKVTFVTNRTHKELLKDKSKPRSRLYDDAIKEISADMFISKELRGNRKPIDLINCALCGAPIDLNMCPVCRHKFNNKYLTDSVAIPSKVVEHLRSKENYVVLNPEPIYDLEEKLFEN
jgi:hypothetical protein